MQEVANDLNISLSSSEQVSPNFWTDPKNGIPYYGPISNAHSSHPTRDRCTTGGVAVTNQVARSWSKGNASRIWLAIHSAVGCAVTLVQVSRRRSKRRITRP
jgi:hypothetical protein